MDQVSVMQWHLRKHSSDSVTRAKAQVQNYCLFSLHFSSWHVITMCSVITLNHELHTNRSSELILSTLVTLVHKFSAGAK